MTRCRYILYACVIFLSTVEKKYIYSFWCLCLSVQHQCTPFKIMADRYKNTIIIDKIMKHSNDAVHSLTVCKSHMVFTLVCMAGVFSPVFRKNLRTFESFLFHPIWLFELYLMPGKLNFKSILKSFDCFTWSLALSSDWAGSTGLANRHPAFESGVFSDKWTVLVEFSSAVGVVNQAVSADAVPDRIIAIQGTHAAALQWLLIAVTAINDNREGWPGSVVQHINKHAVWLHQRQMFGSNTHGPKWQCLWHETHMVSHIMKSCTRTHRNTSVQSTYSTYRLLNAWPH